MSKIHQPQDTAAARCRFVTDKKSKSVTQERSFPINRHGSMRKERGAAPKQRRFTSQKRAFLTKQRGSAGQERTSVI